jgi:phosphoenolpyruvate carboxykinase (ATP)
VPGVPDAVLNPRDAWSNAAEYDQQAKRLKGMFDENFLHIDEGGAAGG